MGPEDLSRLPIPRAPSRGSRRSPRAKSPLKRLRISALCTRPPQPLGCWHNSGHQTPKSCTVINSNATSFRSYSSSLPSYEDWYTGQISLLERIPAIGYKCAYCLISLGCKKVRAPFNVQWVSRKGKHFHSLPSSYFWRIDSDIFKFIEHLPTL